MIPCWLCLLAMGAMIGSGFIIGYWLRSEQVLKSPPKPKNTKEVDE